MNEKDISKLLPDWTLSYLISESGNEKIYRAEKETGSGTKHAIIRAVFLPCTENRFETLKKELGDESALREYTAKKLNECKREFTFIRSMAGKKGWLRLRESYDISNVNSTQALVVARFDDARSIDDFIKTNGFTQGAVLKLGMDMCIALERGRKMGKIHGLLKPEYVFVDENCNFKVAKVDINVAESGKYPDYPLNELAFAAPHTDKLAYVDDVYSVGLMMYYYLNDRKLPFENELPRDEAIKKRLSGAKLPPASHEIAGVTDIIEAACKFDKAQRYKTPYAMRKEIENIYFRMQKKIEEDEIKESARQKQLAANGNTEKEKDISANRERVPDEDDIRLKNERKKKTVFAVCAVAVIFVLGVIFAGFYTHTRALKNRDVANHKILLASTYYKGTERAEEFSFDYYYDGSEKRPPIVISGLEELVEGEDYSLVYEDNIEVGTATLTVYGMGEYSGEKSRTFNIKPAKPTDITDFNATEITDSSAKLSWSSCENAEKYYIYIYNSQKNKWGKAAYVVDSSVGEMTVSGLEPDTEYLFGICGVRYYNGETERSARCELSFMTEISK